MHRFFPFLLLLIFSHPISAQVDSFRSSEKIRYTVKYHHLEEGHLVFGNRILREIAKHVLRDPWLVDLDLCYMNKISIGPVDGKNRLRVFFRDPVMKGDIRYRQFDISDVLIPNRMNLTLRWANRYDTTSYTEQNLVSQRIVPSDSLLFEIPVTGFDPSLDTILLRDVQFYYDSLGFSLFMHRMHLIDDYYASSVLVDTLTQVADTMNISREDLLPVHFIQIEELNKVLTCIRDRDFLDNLPDPTFDPLQLSSRYLTLFKISRTLTYNYCDALLGSGAIPWNRDLSGIAGFYTARILSFVEKSQLMGDRHGDIYYDFLDHYFDTLSFPPDKNIPELLMRKMFPDAETDSLWQFISWKILLSYHQLAQDLMKRNRFAEAVSIMEHAKKFNATFPAGIRFGGVDESLTQASTEIFNAYIGIATDCISNRKYDMADQYLENAAAYYKMHPGLIPNDSLYRQVYGQLFFMRNSQCDQLLEQEKFKEALECYQLFEQIYTPDKLIPVNGQMEAKKNRALAGICQESVNRSIAALTGNQFDTALYYFDNAATLLSCLPDHSVFAGRHDSITPFIEQIRYKKFFSDGVGALNHRQFTLALQYFDQARSLSDRHGLAPSGDYDSLYRRAMKNHLLIDLSLAQKDIWSSRFGKAEATLDTIRNAGTRYGLGRDQEFTSVLTWFGEKIREQRCRDLADSVTYTMIRADRAVALKNYMNAGLYIHRAFALADSVPGCGIASTNISDTLKKYEKAIAYQEELTRAERYAASGQYDTVLSILYRTERSYKSYNLDNLGCPFESGFNFVDSRNNPYLVFQAVLFYQGLHDDREAFRYLCLLPKKGFPADKALQAQQQLGISLAEVDYQKGITSMFAKEKSPAHPVAINEKWFRAFREAYKDEYARLSEVRSSVP